MLAAGLAQLPSLESLHLVDWRSPTRAGTGVADPLALPGLDQLPGLRHVRCEGGVPPELWRCSQVTKLECIRAELQLLSSLQLLYGLRRLALTSCRLPDADAFPAALGPGLARLQQMALLSCDMPGAAAFPPALCPALGQLTRLRLGSLAPSSLRNTRALPAAFSQLTALRRLNLGGLLLGRAGIDAVCPLGGLTYLNVSGCGLTALPHGRYLSRLEM